MPHPVEPPEIPVIIRPVTSSEVAKLNLFSNSSSGSAIIQTHTTSAIPTPTRPETLPPESAQERQEVKGKFMIWVYLSESTCLAFGQELREH